MPTFTETALADLQDWGVAEAEAREVAASGDLLYEHHLAPDDGWVHREKTIDGRLISIIHHNDDTITRVRVLGRSQTSS